MIFLFPFLSRPKKKLKPKGQVAVFVGLLHQLLGQVQSGGYMANSVVQQCTSMLELLGPMEEEEEEATRAFMVSEGRWDTCEPSSWNNNMPTHLIDDAELERKPVGVPMSIRCCDHMDALWVSQAEHKCV